MLVDFMIIGAQKSGTTSLAYQLSQHPQISFSQEKEPHYFSKISDWQNHLTEYHANFHIAPGKRYGEASTSYTWLLNYPDTAKRIYAYNPSVKLIYLMRHPVERVISHYNHNYIRGKTNYPKEKEIIKCPNYINWGRYAVQIRPYLELFPRNQILLLIFEEYMQHTLPTLHQVAEFLGIDPSGFDSIDLSPQYQSVGRYAPRQIKRWLTPVARLFPLNVRDALNKPFVYKMKAKIAFSEETKQLLWRFFVDDVRAIEAILGREIPSWHVGYDI